MHPITMEQGGSWHTKSRPRMLVASKATFLKNYLAVSAWILNGYSIERHEKKQPFRLSGVKIGLMLERSKMSFPPLSCHNV